MPCLSQIQDNALLDLSWSRLGNGWDLGCAVLLFCMCLWIIMDFRLVFPPLFPHFHLLKTKAALVPDFVPYS